MEDNKTKFLKGISVQTIITLLMGVLELLVFAIMSRLLTKEDFGYYAALLGIVTICTSITEAGLGAAIIQKKDASSSFVSTAFTLSWLMGAIGTVLMFLFAPLISNAIADDHLTLPLRIMSINIFLACIASVGKSVLIRDLKFKTYGTYEVMAYIFSSCIGIALAFFHFRLYAIMSISVCNFILLNIILYSRSVKLPKMHIVKSEVGGIFSFGGWLTLSVVVNQITQQLDKLFMPRWISVTALGAYNRPAGFLASITGKINGIFDTVLFPMLSKLQSDPERVQSIFIRSIKLLNSFSSVLFCVFFFNAHLIVYLFFGEKWLDLVPVFQIISIYVIFNIDNRLVDCFFRSLGYVKTGFYLRIIASIITLTLLCFGCKYGLEGAAIALVSANITTVVIKILTLSRKVNIHIFDVLRSFLIACKPMLLILPEGLIYLFTIQANLTTDFVAAIIMGITILIEFLAFPKLVGEEYANTIYSKIKPKFTLKKL